MVFDIITYIGILYMYIHEEKGLVYRDNGHCLHYKTLYNIHIVGVDLKVDISFRF